MKYLKYCLTILIGFGLLATNSCKKDNAYSNTGAGTFSMKVNATVRGQGFALNSPFYDVLSYKYKLSTLKYYVSHLSLIKDDNTLQEVDTVSLADYDHLAFGQAFVISGKIPEGHYKGVKFWIGLDSVYNHKDATQYGPNQPLSIYQGTNWGWTAGYRFMMITGTVDSTPGNTNTAVEPLMPFEYHTGLETMYTEVNMPAHSFDVVKGQQTDYNIVLDVNKMFYSPTDTIVIYREPYTHATDHVSLALRVAHNTSLAFSEQ